MNPHQDPDLILMADDDADDQLLARDALRQGVPGAEIRFVADGEELLDYLLHRHRYQAPGSSPRPRVILLDLNLPRKDGREVLQEIKQHPDLRNIPVVVFTTSTSETDVRRTYELGASSFITKPARFDALVQIFQTLNSYWSGVVRVPATDPEWTSP